MTLDLWLFSEREIFETLDYKKDIFSKNSVDPVRFARRYHEESKTQLSYQVEE